MKIMKFGGSAMANAENIRLVGQIILEQPKKTTCYVIVSACCGITDALLNCAKLAAQSKSKYRKIAQDITNSHIKTLKSLAPKTNKDHPIYGLLAELGQLLEGVWLLKEAAPSTLDNIASFGERLSTELLASYLNHKRKACAIDTRSLILTDDNFGEAHVLMNQTRRRIQRWHTQFSTKSTSTIPVLTGFIAETLDGRTTTIGRNGSDYSAAIIGAALNASIVEIWTDVDGVYSANPQQVPDAFVVPTLSYEEAMELSHFGTEVLHPEALAPLRDLKIPIQVKNTFRPSASGTQITQKQANGNVGRGPASGITSIDGITLLSWSGRRQTDISSTVDRLLRALATAKINIFLISQASSQHTLTLAIRTSDTATAINAIKETFHAELKQKLIKLDQKRDQTIVAIVGDNMQGVPGIAGKMFHSLGQQGISIRAIAQGSTEHNISMVIDEKTQTRALNIVHDAFFSRDKKLGLLLIGVGNVGATLLNMLAEQINKLRENGFHIKLCGITNSRRMLFCNKGINPAKAKTLLLNDKQTKPLNFEKLLKEINSADFLPLALVDCTASSNVVAKYSDFIHAGLHIITPNKKANVLPLVEWNKLIKEFKTYDKYFLYQTNVGGGLPILSTMKDLLAGGDQILKIEGIFSGTLSYLFNNYDGSKPFAEILQMSEENGFTEPDPREDLSGMDVARKLVVMAREMGQKMELKNVNVENLVPTNLRKNKFSKSFYKAFAKHENYFKKKLQSGKKQDAVLRYVATLENNKATAGLKLISKKNPIAFTKASDNIIAITTQRYKATPLVIQGLGAGADVTAMGVFSDILRLLHYLPY